VEKLQKLPNFVSNLYLNKRDILIKFEYNRKDNIFDEICLDMGVYVEKDRSLEECTEMWEVTVNDLSEL